MHHTRRKEWWSRALLVAGREGLNSAEIGWLEGRLHGVLESAEACEVMNTQRPRDESLTGRERELLERFVEPICAALRASGYPPDPATPEIGPDAGRPQRVRRAVSQETLLRVLREAGVAVPLEIHADYRGRRVTATIARDGRVLSRVRTEVTPFP